MTAVPAVRVSSGRRIYEGDILLPGGDTAGGVPGTSTNADLNQYVNEDGEADGEGADRPRLRR